MERHRMPKTCNMDACNRTEENTTMTFKPFDFQREDALQIERFGGRCLLAQEPGIGKTVISLLWAKWRPELRPIVVVCPASIKWNWSRIASTHFGMIAEVLEGMKATDNPSFHTKQLFILNYDILKGWYDFILSLKPQLLILDECFPKGTLIQTNKGILPIEEIVEKEMKLSVSSFNFFTNAIEEKEVTHYFKIRRKERLVTIRHEFGEITCTENHRVWTENRGYVKACEIESEDHLLVVRSSIPRTKLPKKSKVLRQSMLSTSPRKISQETESDHHLPRMQKRISGSELHEEQIQILQSIVQGEKPDETTRNTRKNIFKGDNTKSYGDTQTLVRNERRKDCEEKFFSSNENKKPVQESRNRQEDDENERTQRNAACVARNTRGKRTTDKTANFPVEHPSRLLGELENRTSDTNHDPSREWLSDKLQSRHRESGDESSSRNRRERTQLGKEKRKGQKEERLPRISRVESVRIHEQTSGPEFTRDSEDDPFVYCLEVKDNHNFFADNVLVSNCHYVVNRRSQRSKYSKKLAQKIPNVLALSGTPLTNRLSELWQVLNIVRPDLYPSFWSYAIEFIGPVMKPWGWDFSGSQNIDKLYRVLKKRTMIRRLKSEVLKDLPEKQQIVVPLEIERRKEYNKANKEFIRWLAEKSLAKARKALAAESLTKVGYLKRLAGELKLKSVCEWVDNFLEESDEKLILFCQHTAIIEALLARYEGKSVRVDGKVSSRERQKAIDAFLVQKRVRLLIGQTRAAGTGWSAKGVSNVAFVEIGWTPGEHTQAMDRSHGIGRGTEGKHTTVYWLVARDTVDEKVLSIITEKQKILDAALDGGNGSADVNVLDELLASIMREKK